MTIMDGIKIGVSIGIAAGMAVLGLGGSLLLLMWVARLLGLN